MNQNEKNEIVAKGELTFSQYIKYNFYHQRTYLAICTVIGFLFFMFFYNSFNIIGIDSFSIEIFMLTLVTTLLYIILVVAISFFRISREFKSDQLIKSEITYTISSNEINQVSKRFNSHYKWDDFIKMKVHKDMFLLYLSRNKAIILPGNFFKSDNDIQLFMKYLSDNKK